MDALRRISVPESQGLFGGDGPDGESFGLPELSAQGACRLKAMNYKAANGSWAQTFLPEGR
jgi:hypothetical protein